MNPTKEEILQILEKAQTAVAKHNYEAAIRHYTWVEQNIQDDPDNLPLIWIEMGWCLYYLQNYQNALKYFEKSLQSGRLTTQQVFDCIRLIGYCYEYAGYTDKGIAYLKDALLQDVEEVDKRFVYFELGKIYFSQQIAGKAKPYLEKSAKLFTGEDLDYLQTTRYYLGFLAYFEQNIDKAETIFREYVDAAANETGKAPGHFGLAHIYFHRKEYDDLRASCQSVMELDPDFFDKETVAYFLCKSYKELKRWDDLSTFLPQLFENYPNGRYHTAYPELQRALKKQQSTTPDK